MLQLRQDLIKTLLLQLGTPAYGLLHNQQHNRHANLSCNHLPSPQYNHLLSPLHSQLCNHQDSPLFDQVLNLFLVHLRNRLYAHHRSPLHSPLFSQLCNHQDNPLFDQVLNLFLVHLRNHLLSHLYSHLYSLFRNLLGYQALNHHRSPPCNHLLNLH